MTTTTPSGSSAPRRGLPRWLKTTIITVLVLANLLALGAFWAISTGQSLLSQADTDSEVVGVLDAPTGDSLVFLVVGSDSREGLDDLENFGRFGGQRGDVVMLVNLNRATGEAEILSIPRDLWVNIPGHGENKINAAYAFGGPALMVETIQQNLGVPVNHYVEIGFVGFIALVDEIGGIELTFPYPARDSSSGLDVDAGTQLLNGDMALAYARSRKYQELQNGSWVSVDANDIGRTQRQQAVVGAIVRKLKSPATITEAGEIADALARHMTIDASLADASIAGLAWDFKGLLSGDIDGVTLPVDGASRGGASVVIAREPDASQVIEDFLAGTELSNDPLTIQVLNGNGVSGAAGEMSQVLASQGFAVASIGDADKKDYATTTILVPDGSGVGATVVAALGFGTVVNAQIDDQYDAVVIVGGDVS